MLSAMSQSRNRQTVPFLLYEVLRAVSPTGAERRGAVARGWAEGTWEVA